MALLASWRFISFHQTLALPQPVLTLYTRLYCHLCEAMLGALRALQPELGFELEAVDIDADAALVARYNEAVPVLCLGEREICRHFLDEAALRACLAAC